ncbi:MAG: T9SS type A sorting domain-containing protein, partial [FCB group bacterium]|nr:T9SS type A sorting domain-containing protein [FCB group bacterium]
YAYLGVYGSGSGYLEILDLNNLTVVGYYDSIYCYDIIYSDSLLYVAGGTYTSPDEDMFMIIDVSDPANPYEIGCMEMPDHAVGVAVSDSFAYIAAYNYGLMIVDITDPANPVENGNFNTPGEAYDVAISGEWAFVADGHSGLWAIDVSDPFNPQYGGFIDPPGNAFVRKIAVSGNYAYFTANSSTGLLVYDITDPTNMIEAGNYTPFYSYDGLIVFNSVLYSVSSPFGLTILDVTNPVNIFEISAYEVSGIIYDVEKTGDLAVLLNTYERLHFVDVSNPANPVEIGTYEIEDYVSEMCLEDDKIYLSNYNLGLLILDISDPNNPVEAGQVVYENYAIINATVSSDYAYCYAQTLGFNNSNHLLVVDVSDPAFPVLTDSIMLADYCQDIAISGGYAYIANSDSGLTIIDVSDPYDISITTGYLLPYGDRAECIEAEGGYAYIGTGYYDRLYIFNVTDPINPSIAGIYDADNNIYGITVSGNYVYIAHGSYGMTILDVSNPADIYEVGWYNTPGTAYSIAADGDYAYVADYYYFGIYDCSLALPVEQRFNDLKSYNISLSAAPNPFNAKTVISFELRASSEVSLIVYDVQGRKIQSLVTGHLSLGAHEVVWNAEGMSSGIYFARLEAGDFTQTQKLLLIK